MRAEPDPNAVADAFALGRPKSPLAPAGGAVVTTAWRLDTDIGRFLVKRVRLDEPDWWRAAAVSAMDFERRAITAGVSMPRPVEPDEPHLGVMARVDDSGPVRVYEWLDGHSLTKDDDVAEWLGETLAILNSLDEAPTREMSPVELGEYGIHDRGDWRAWFAEARDRALPFGDVGLANLPGIAEATDFVARSLDGLHDLVITHRDVERQNIFVTADGPVLIDFDWIGRDSATLVAAWAAVSYATFERTAPDPDRVRRVVDSYLAHGGSIDREPPYILARRVSLRLIRLAFNVWVALGHRPSVEEFQAYAIRTATEKIPTFPELLHQVRDWAVLVRA